MSIFNEIVNKTFILEQIEGKKFTAHKLYFHFAGDRSTNTLTITEVCGAVENTYVCFFRDDKSQMFITKNDENIWVPYTWLINKPNPISYNLSVYQKSISFATPIKFKMV